MAKKKKKTLTLPEDMSRITALCPCFGRCGGCALQDLAYTDQLTVKTTDVREKLAPLLGHDAVASVDLVPAEEQFRYRNKMEFSFGEENGEIQLGLHERGRFWQIVDLDDCLIATEHCKELMKRIKEQVALSQLPIYNPKKQTGYWRHIILRSSSLTGKVMVVVVTHEGAAGYINALAQQMTQDFPFIESFYWGVNTKISDVATPDELFLLAGNEYLRDAIGDVKINVHPMSFLQPNILEALRAYDDIKKAAALTGSETILDLYCGMGSIGLFCADMAAHVIGIEENHINVRLACDNAAQNEAKNTHFVQANIEKMLKTDTGYLATFTPDIIILDPPRAGLHKKVYQPILAAHPRTIIYLSCNITSLVRDVSALLSMTQAYSIEQLTVYDMFPNTPHVETLLVLRRNEK